MRRLRRDHPRRDAAEDGRLRRGGPAAPQKHQRAGAAAHRARRRARQDHRPRQRRRRLHDQAVRARRAAGSPARAHAPPGRSAVREAGRRRPRAEPGKLRPGVRVEVHTPQLQGVLAGQGAHGERRAGGVEGHAHREGVGRGVERRRQQRGGLRVVSAQEDEVPGIDGAHRDATGSWPMPRPTTPRKARAFHAEEAARQVHRAQHGHRCRGVGRGVHRHLRHRLPAERRARARDARRCSCPRRRRGRRPVERHPARRPGASGRRPCKRNAPRDRRQARRIGSRHSRSGVLGGGRRLAGSCSNAHYGVHRRRRAGAGRGRAGRSARRLRQPGRPRAVLREAHRGRRRVPRVRGHERRKRLADPGRHTGGGRWRQWIAHGASSAGS